MGFNFSAKLFMVMFVLFKQEKGADCLGIVDFSGDQTDTLRFLLNMRFEMR